MLNIISLAQTKELCPLIHVMCVDLCTLGFFKSTRIFLTNGNEVYLQKDPQKD